MLALSFGRERGVARLRDLGLVLVHLLLQPLDGLLQLLVLRLDLGHRLAPLLHLLARALQRLAHDRELRLALLRRGRVRVRTRARARVGV